jgi:hypothetical protein
VGLSAVGLEALRSGDPLRLRWSWAPGLLAAGIALWCLVRSVYLPEPVATQLAGPAWRGRLGAGGVGCIPQIQASYRHCFLLGAGLASVAAAGWVGVRVGFARRRLWLAAFAAVALAELFAFAWRNDRQAECRLYFPPVAALAELRDRPPGRALGILCLPPNLNYWHDLRDLRGYDAVDPGRVIALLDPVRDRRVRSPSYARTTTFVPTLLEKERGSVRAPPLLDMLNLRYLISRRPTPPGFPVRIQRDGYWVAENPRALPRAFVPKSVRPAPAESALLAALADPDFNPRERAFAESDAACEGVEGSATIVGEHPCEVRLEADLASPGMVVLADLWDPGWRATVDGAPAEVLRTNFALRGVRVPAGRHAVVFRYEPASFTWGVRVAASAAVVLAAWAAVLVVARRRRPAGP